MIQDLLMRSAVQQALPGQSGVFVKPSSVSIVGTLNLSGVIYTANLANAFDSDVNTSGRIETSGYSAQTARYVFNEPQPAGSILRVKMGWHNTVVAGIRLYAYTDLALSGKKQLASGSSDQASLISSVEFTFTLTESLAVLDFYSHASQLNYFTNANIFDISVEL